MTPELRPLTFLTETEKDGVASPSPSPSARDAAIRFEQGVVVEFPKAKHIPSMDSVWLKAEASYDENGD